MSFMRLLLFIFGLGAVVTVGCSRNESRDDSKSTNTTETNRITLIDEPTLTTGSRNNRAIGTNVTDQSFTTQTRQTNKSTNSADLFTVVTDAQSGQYAAVSGDGHVLTLKDKSGKLVWVHDIIAEFGTNLPIYSNGKIVSLQFIEGQIVIYVGKECICIDPQTGRTVRTAVR